MGENYLGTTTIGGNPADLVENADGSGSTHVAVPNKDPSKGTDFQHTYYGSDGGYKGHVTEHADGTTHHHGDTSDHAGS